MQHVNFLVCGIAFTSIIQWTILEAVLFPHPLPKHHKNLKLLADDAFDFLLFVQRWPASVCVNGHFTSGVCAFPPGLSATDWIIHGLWPSKLNSTGPEHCRTMPFSPDPLQPLLNDLNAFWPSLTATKRPDKFWGHEWKMHGTCAQSLASLTGELNYFQRSLELRAQYNLYTVLQGQKIVPSSNRTYTHDDVAGALQRQYNKQIGVYCSYSNDTSQHYVAEVRVCLHKDLTLMDCPDYVTHTEEASSCPKRKPVVYPAFSPGSFLKIPIPEHHQKGRRNKKA